MDDIDLVKEILNGNIDCFNILISKYELPVWRFIYKMIGDGEAAKDITQEVFITVYNKLYTYKGDYKFSNWFFQVARNKCVDYIRKHKKEYETVAEYDENITSRELSPHEVLELKETKELIQRFMKDLDGIEREILILKYMNDDMKFSDIAEILNMKLSTVKTKYYRLWDKFKAFAQKEEKRCRV